MSVIDFIPRSVEEREQIPADGGREIVAEVDERVYDELSRMNSWIGMAHDAEKYYASEQYRTKTQRRDKNRIRLVANFIRRDVDLIGAEILDGKPVVNPIGRNSGDYELGKQLMQILDWSRDEEDNWDADLEKCITMSIHIGEGALFEGWDQYAANGMGMPIAFCVDTRYLLWDRHSEDLQKDDAQWIIMLKHERIKDLEERYPEHEGEFPTETYDHFLTPPQTVAALSPTRSSLPIMTERKKDERVWVKRQWEKKRKFKRLYRYAESGERAFVETEEGKVELTSALYRELTAEEQRMVIVNRTPVTEIWEAVVAGPVLLEYHLSPFDKSNGGHGHYPFAFFSYELLLDEPRARGEISFLISIQDIYNESISQLLEQLFLSNVGYWHVFRGSLMPQEREKLTKLFYEPHQVIESSMGVPPPEHRGVNPTGLQAAASIIPLLKRFSDDTSGVQAVDRGDVPGNIQSGRAIRALQAKTSRLNIKVKRHMESGLRRATLLRLHNICQFMRGPRTMQVVDPGSKKGKYLFLAHSEEEAMYFFELQQGEEGLTTADGKPAEVMVLNDAIVDNVVFERVKLTLDTRQESNKLERMDQAEMFMNIVGPAAVPWAAQELEVNNRDMLLDAIEERDAGMSMLKMAEDFQKKTGMTVEEALEMVTGAMNPTVPAGPTGGPPPPGVAGLMPPGGPTSEAPIGAAPPIPGALPSQMPPQRGVSRIAKRAAMEQ